MRQSERGLRVLIVIGCAQLAISVVLVLWWGHLLLEMGGPEAKTMVYAEGGFFLVAFLVSSLILVGLLYRDLKRKKSLHAFFASVTHELKTPLTSIRLQAESIGDCDTKDPYVAKLAGRLLEDTQRLELQVERTLELARVEGGGAVLSSPIALRPLIQGLLQAWENLPLRINLDLSDEKIEGDERAIQIILRNLLENSIKHGGVEQPEVKVRVFRDDEHVVLDYRDNGQGLEVQARQLGELFVKGPKSSGAGVGLYLVNKLMDRMGGGVRYSEKGDTGFQIRLFFRRGVQHV